MLGLVICSWREDNLISGRFPFAFYRKKLDFSAFEHEGPQRGSLLSPHNDLVRWLQKARFREGAEGSFRAM